MACPGSRRSWCSWLAVGHKQLASSKQASRIKSQRTANLLLIILHSPYAHAGGVPVSVHHVSSAVCCGLSFAIRAAIHNIVTFKSFKKVCLEALSVRTAADVRTAGPQARWGPLGVLFNAMSRMSPFLMKQLLRFFQGEKADIFNLQEP